MNATIDAPTAMQLRSHKPQRYLALLLLLPLLAYLLPLLLIRAPDFEGWAGTRFGPALDYGFTLQGQDAGIVIFGDSSAFFGIDPQRMSDMLHVKTLNLPNTVGSLPVTGDAVLRQYLARNAPPRLIIFYFAPWNLDYSHRPESQFIHEGEEMLFRHGTVAQISQYVRHHVLASLRFPFEFYSALSKQTLIHALLSRQNRVSEVAAHFGHLEMTDSVDRQNASCTLPAKFVQGHAFTSIQELAAAYRSKTTDVLIFMAPIPACQNARSVLDRRYAEVPTSPPKILDSTDFIADDQYVHLAASGVPTATRNLVDAVQTHMAGTAYAAR